VITCNFEDGGKASLRHVTVNVIVLKENKILLGKRGSYKGKPIIEFGKWGLIGGYVNRDEFLEDAVRREVMEESGWIIDNLTLLRINDNPNRPREDRQNIDITFIADAIEKKSESDEEVTSLQWFNLNEVPSFDQIAFDHGDSIELYKKYLNNKFQLPIIGKTSLLDK